MRAYRVALAVVILAVAAWLPAQSLLDDPTYRTLVDELEALRVQAQEAAAEGRYDDAVTLAEQAEEKAEETEAYAETRTLAYRANSWLVVARNRVIYADSISADERYPAEYSQASESLSSAEAAFEAAEYESAINLAKLVISSLEEIEPAAIVVEPEPEPEMDPEPEPEPEPEPMAKPEEPVLPRYYVVRLIPERRDCFWRIAEYDFVYGDPWQWRVLYEANKDRIPDPDNPDLIEPGMIMEIPSIASEERSGTWEPSADE